MTHKGREELLRFLRGIAKKHGPGIELVVKVETRSGKVRRRHGRWLGLRDDAEVGLHNDAKGCDTWYPLDRVLDVWKRGAPPDEG